MSRPGAPCYPVGCIIWGVQCFIGGGDGQGKTFCANCLTRVSIFSNTKVGVAKHHSVSGFGLRLGFSGRGGEERARPVRKFRQDPEKKFLG